MTIKKMYRKVLAYTPYYNGIDAEVAKDKRCSAGHLMKYRGFIRGKSYRAFLICDVCDHAQEF